MGDFVSRGWLTSSREGLDKLLQEALAALLSSSATGKEAIMHAPCLVLTIRPGVIGDQGVVTVVLPSRDRVGRIFPLCAGVQWTDEKSCMGWPSLDYANALIARVQCSVDADADLDALLTEVVALGSPQQFRQTFHELGGDETLPRLAADTKLLRVQGPLTAMSPALTALCSMLTGASDLLGMCLAANGEAQEFFACRQFDSGAPLAALFDGAWAEHGWTSYGAPEELAVLKPAVVIKFGDDATQPRHRMIDTVAPAPDSLDTS